MKTYLLGLINYAITLKLRFRVGDLDVPEERGIPEVRRRGKNIHRCAFVAKKESRTNIVRECEMFKVERDVVEEMRKIDERDMDKIGTLFIDISEKMIATVGWWPQKAKQERG